VDHNSTGLLAASLGRRERSTESGAAMSYYFGFRFGWVRLGRRAIGYYDPRLYKKFYPRALRLGHWALWVLR
jgi:hypothetical protein